MLCCAWLLSHVRLCNPMAYSPPGSSVHGESPGKNTGVGCHALLQGILPTQGSNPGLPHCRPILYHLCHQGRELLYVCVCTRVCVCIKAQVTLWCHQNSSAIRLSKNSSAAWETCRKIRFNPWSQGSLGVGNGNPVQYP